MASKGPNSILSVLFEASSVRTFYPFVEMVPLFPLLAFFSPCQEHYLQASKGFDGLEQCLEALIASQLGIRNWQPIFGAETFICIVAGMPIGSIRVSNAELHAPIANAQDCRRLFHFSAFLLMHMVVKLTAELASRVGICDPGVARFKRFHQFVA